MLAFLLGIAFGEDEDRLDHVEPYRVLSCLLANKWSSCWPALALLLSYQGSFAARFLAILGQEAGAELFCISDLRTVLGWMGLPDSQPLPSRPAPFPAGP